MTFQIPTALTSQDPKTNIEVKSNTLQKTSDFDVCKKKGAALSAVLTAIKKEPENVSEKKSSQIPNTGTVPWKITQIVSRKKTLGRVKATLQGL